MYEKMADTYLGLPTYQQAVVPLVALHTAVLAAWMLSPALRTTSLMYRFFTHRPASGRVVTLLTSATSHKGLAHFVLNNLALWSVGSCAIQALPRDKRDARVEADTQPHFVAFYVAAGLFASLVSHLALALRWRMVPKPAQLLARRASLGASGAIYAAFALCACTMPHVQLSLVFFWCCSMWWAPFVGGACLIMSLIWVALRLALYIILWVPRYGIHAEASMVLGERTNRRELMK